MIVRHKMLLLALVLVLVAGCGSGPDVQTATVPAASSTPLPATVTPLPPAATPTSTLSPTPTRDPALVQQEALFQASLQYLADDDAGANAVARSLQFAPGGTAKAMCGPLAFAILRDAGLVSKYTDLRDYWLLNPREDGGLLERTFPRTYFEWLKVEKRIDAVDYRQFPLLPGDVLYLYQGFIGEEYFEHVMVVTRVDADGRAYTVTNNYTDDGFVIQEYMIYDPANPGEGIFYEWTDPANTHLGLTGFGGFDLWRPKSLPYYADQGDPALVDAIDTALAAVGGDWYAGIRDVDGKVLYSRRANYRMSEPLAARLPVAMLFFEALEAQNISEVAAYIDSKMFDGSSYRTLLNNMLIHGQAEAQASLIQAITYLGLDVSGALQTWGLQSTYIAQNTTSVEDLLILLGGLYRNDMIPKEGRQIILDIMAGNYLDGPSLGGDPLRETSPGGYAIYNFPVARSINYPLVSQLAILDGQDEVYLVGIFGYQARSAPISFEKQEETMRAILMALWEYLSQE